MLKKSRENKGARSRSCLQFNIVVHYVERIIPKIDVLKIDSIFVVLVEMTLVCIRQYRVVYWDIDCLAAFFEFKLLHKKIVPIGIDVRPTRHRIVSPINSSIFHFLFNLVQI